MSNVTYTFKILKVGSADEGGLTDVIKKVWWAIDWTDGTSSTTSVGSTEITHSVSDTFVSASSITDEQLSAWVVDELGPMFIEMQEFSTQLVLAKTAEDNLKTLKQTDEYYDYFPEDIDQLQAPVEEV